MRGEALLGEDSQIGLRPVLGIWAGVSTVVAVVIGAGIFSVPQQVARYLGGTTQILLLWTGVGAVCFVTALVFAEIAARFPRSGADYLAVRAVYGRHVAFVFGWRGFALAHPSNRAALALVGAQYMAVLFPALANAELALGLTLLVALGLINASGVQVAAAVHGLLALVKVGLLIVFVVLAIGAATPMTVAGSETDRVATFDAGEPARAALTSDAPVLERWALASLLVFFAYTGFPRIVQIAEEFRAPQRVLAKSMALSILGVVVLYVAINASYLRLLGLEGVRATATVGADAMEAVFGRGGAVMVAFIIVVSVLGSISVSMMTASRLYFAMSRAGDFFRGLAHLHRTTRVPTRAIAAHVVLAILFLIVRRNFVDLVLSATFINLIFYALRVQSLFTLRRRDLGDPGGFRMPLYPWLPLLALVGMYGVLLIRLVVDWERAWFDVLVLAVGFSVSWVWFRGKERAEVPNPARLEPAADPEERP